MDTHLTVLTFDTVCRCCYVELIALKPPRQMRFLKGSSQIPEDCVGQIGLVNPDLNQYTLTPCNTIVAAFSRLTSTLQSKTGGLHQITSTH